MDVNRRQRVEELFDQFVDPPSDRRLLAAACGGDRELFDEVSALLDADVDALPILGLDVARLAIGLLGSGSRPVIPGRFGRYVIREHLGEGGMGSVYLAEREELGDSVAVKFLHDGWSSPARRRRFAVEQRTLAGLKHHAIARLYDAGVVNGTPWFAMEYVPGRSIVDHCQHYALPLRDRLRLFRLACEAVGYAHQKLTVHLDLKPSNILVTSEGDVKLVDFGIARQLIREGGEAERTVTGQRLLSLNYASPEQISGDPVNVQADVYSLGAVLHELLVGRPPVDLGHLNPAELTRVLADEPRRPSRLAPGRAPAVVHASRSQWKDLDVLCLKALRRRNADRYQTVDRLISDIDHLLRDEPLDARVGHLRAYRMRKFLIRHRRPVAATAGALATIAALTVFFTVRLVDARDQAVSSESRLQRIHRLMLNLFESDDAAGPAEGLRVVSLLDRGVHEADSLDKDVELQAELRSTLGGLYHKLGHIDRADPLLLAAWTTQMKTLGPDHPQTVRTQLALAALRLDQSNADEAERLVRESLAVANRQRPRDRVQVATVEAVLGKVLSTEGKYEAAVPLLETAVKTLPPSTELSDALGDLANTYYYLGHVADSEAVNFRSLSLDQQLFGARHPNVAVDLYNLGNIELDRGDYRQGEQMFRRALDINDTWYGTAHPKTASNLLMVGRALAYHGQLEAASGFYDRALTAMRTVYGENHLRYASVLSLMGDLRREERKWDEAEQLFHRAAEIFRRTTSERHEFYLHQLSNLGSVYLARQQFQKAERQLRVALAGLIAVVPDQRYTGLAQIRLAGALAGQQRYDESLQQALAGYDTLRKLPSASGAELQDARRQLVRIYLALNQPDKANELKAQLAREAQPSVAGQK